jgi:hypothetical protein
MDNCDEIFDNILNKLNEIKDITFDMTEKIKISENNIQKIIDNLTIINDSNNNNDTNDSNDIDDSNNTNNSNNIYKLKIIYDNTNNTNNTKIINNDINYI